MTAKTKKPKPAPLPRYVLRPSKRYEIAWDGTKRAYLVWELVETKTRAYRHTYTAKYTALQAWRPHSLAKIFANEEASVPIMDRHGKFQEERTYPRRRDPRRSKG